MIAWIIGIVILLVISLFIKDQTVESFEYNPPTVIPSKVRADLTCSDRNQSAIYDRFDNAKLDPLGSALKIPPSSRFIDLGVNLITRNFYGAQTGDTTQALANKCNGGTDPKIDTYGTKVFIDTGEPALDNNGPMKDNNNQPYNLVDLFCCKGGMFQRPGTVGENNKVCLPPCPSNYTVSSYDATICIRNDSNCVYTYDLSANIQNNWFKTCAALYKENTSLISTIQSISSVVSTFSIQSSTVQSNYTLLNSQLGGYTTPGYKFTHRNNDFSNITNDYTSLFNIQRNISDKYNILLTDKLKFDTLFNNLGCSNYM
jgi:hypothetical protein